MLSKNTSKGHHIAEIVSDKIWFYCPILDIYYDLNLKAYSEKIKTEDKELSMLMTQHIHTSLNNHYQQRMKRNGF